MKNHKNSAPLMIGTMLLILGFDMSVVSAQEQPATRNLSWKLGLEGGMSLLSPDDVNKFIDRVLNSSNIVLIQGSQKMNLGFSVSGYLGLLAGDFIEIRPELGFLLAPKFINISDGSDLDILATSFYPGLSFNIIPKTGGVRPQLGIGAFFYRASIKFDDNQESITWKGNKMGVHATLGLDVKMLPTLGLSLSPSYIEMQKLTS